MIMDAQPDSRSPVAEAELLQQVHAALRTAPAYRQLPQGQRDRMTKNLGTILGALADVETGELPQGPAEPMPLASAQSTRRTTSGGGTSTFSQLKPRQQGISGNATDKGVEAFGNLVDQVDFPEFVSGLIEGVFTSIVNSSIRQMEAYSAMLESVAMSAEQFGHENISDAEARQYLQDSFPDALTAAPSDEGNPLLAFKDGLDGTPDFASFFGSTDAPEDIDEPESEAELVRQAKLKMARSRQQQLATMVVLGINRIIVTDGQINAKVVFDVAMEESASSSSDTSLSDTRVDVQRDTENSASGGEFSSEFEGDFNSRYEHSGRTRGGSNFDYDREKKGTLTQKTGFNFSNSRNRSKVRTNVRTLNANTTNKSNEEIEAKAKLSGEVKINFRSETFPLERLADSGGLELLTARARPEPIRPPTTNSGTTPSEPDSGTAGS